MDANSDLMARISPALARLVQGDQEGARALYAALWAEAQQSADHYTCAVVAHFLAHTYRDPETQLRWHLRALQAADAAGGDRVLPFYPSLHANLAEVYVRLGNPMAASRHLQQAREAASALAEDPYGDSVRTLINRIAESLGPQPIGADEDPAGD